MTAGRSPVSLQRRFFLLLAGVLSLVLAGQALLSLSDELTDLDARVATQGVILAQGVAGSCSALMHGDDPTRFDDLIRRLREEVDLVDLAIVNESGRILGHSDSSRVGQAWKGKPFRVFGAPRARTSLADPFGRSPEYVASAPVLRGTLVHGYVSIRFRSDEARRRMARTLRSTGAFGVFWLAFGAGVGGLFVRRITRPLAALTTAVIAVSEGDLEAIHVEPPKTDDEVGVLQGSFRKLVTALRAKSAENARLLDGQQRLNLILQERVDEVVGDLRKNAAYLESILRCMREGVIACSVEGKVVRANLGAARHLAGLGEPEPGRDVANLLPGASGLPAAVHAAVETGAETQLEIVHPNGAAAPGRRAGPRTLSCAVAPLRRDDGAKLGAIVTLMDVTEARLAETQLRRKDRLSSLGTLAAGLAHELGNYMHAIQGYADLSLRALPAEHPVRRDVQSIHDENAHAVALLDRFLQFARVGQMQTRVQSFSVDSLLRESLDMCSYNVRQAGVTVVDELGLGALEVPCDARLLMQVFVNVALNAVDAMAGREARRLTVRSGKTEDGARVRVELEDTGTGIPPEHLDRVFDPFFTTKEQSGTGLGLAIAHEIVTRHEGTISVESRVGQGTKFTILLPARPSEATS